MKLKRTLTIHRRFFTYYLPSRTLIVPEIRLIGAWLKKWGFDCGDKVTASKISEGTILIRKENYIPYIEI